MSEVQRFWSHEASNIRCVREADFDRVTAERDALRVALGQSGDLKNELQQRLTAADELLDQAVTALNEISRVSRMGEKPFEIATLAIGEMSALKPAPEHPCPVSLDGCDGSCAP